MPEFVVLDNIVPDDNIDINTVDVIMLYRGYSWEELKSLVRPSFCFIKEAVEDEGDGIAEDDPIWDF